MTAAAAAATIPFTTIHAISRVIAPNENHRIRANKNQCAELFRDVDVVGWWDSNSSSSTGPVDEFAIGKPLERLDVDNITVGALLPRLRSTHFAHNYSTQFSRFPSVRCNRNQNRPNTNRLVIGQFFVFYSFRNNVNAVIIIVPPQSTPFAMFALLSWTHTKAMNVVVVVAS